MEKRKKRLGDRKDGYLVRNLDGMHFIVPLLYPDRCDNEAFISERIDITAAQEFLKEKNAGNPEFKYTLFHLVVAALLKTINQRPKMNRFIANKNIYQRNELTAAFVVKKQFSDESEEALAVVHANDDTTIDSIHEDIYRQITACRSEKKDTSTDAMDMFNKMPRVISKTIIAFIRFLDRHGKVPLSLIGTDPYYCTAVLTNLGSIKLKSGYHHLTNWGTNSVFVAIGEVKDRPFYNEDGTYEMRPSLDLGITIDERIADGYYYSKTVRLLKYLLEHPQELDKPAAEKVDYDGKQHSKSPVA